ncbi:MAG: hypothetical protein ACRD1T_15790, partial [Acidimicrobiia bacterium]
VMSTDDFGFRATPVKKSAPTGEAVHVYRDFADLGDGLKAYAFVIRTSSLSALSTGCSGGKNKVCSLVLEGGSSNAKAVDLATGALISPAGTSQLRIDATDVAEPSGGSVPPDTYAVSISGMFSYSLGTSASQLPITAGNVRVIS